MKLFTKVIEQWIQDMTNHDEIENLMKEKRNNENQFGVCEKAKKKQKFNYVCGWELLTENNDCVVEKISLYFFFFNLWHRIFSFIFIAFKV